jgi:hypothetical protein
MSFKSNENLNVPPSSTYVVSNLLPNSFKYSLLITKPWYMLEISDVLKILSAVNSGLIPSRRDLVVEAINDDSDKDDRTIFDQIHF